MARKTSRGRQKIAMARIENETARHVTFSKRRKGLMKKARELNTLTGAEIGVVVFSSGQKVYSFGHPSIESVIEKYEALNTQDVGETPTIEPNSGANPQKLKEKLDVTTSKVDAVRKREEFLDQLAKKSPNHQWWQASIDNLNLDQLDMMQEAMEDLYQVVGDEIKKRLKIIKETNMIGEAKFVNNDDGYKSDAESSTNDKISFNYDFPFAEGPSGGSDDDNNI